jgi:hypothetical protein
MSLLSSSSVSSCAGPSRALATHLIIIFIDLFAINCSPEAARGRFSDLIIGLGLMIGSNLIGLSLFTTFSFFVDLRGIGVAGSGGGSYSGV